MLNQVDGRAGESEVRESEVRKARQALVPTHALVPTAGSALKLAAVLLLAAAAYIVSLVLFSFVLNGRRK